MPVDPDALLKTVANILSNIPSGIVVALLLGGPTAIWLILRLVHPREAQSRFGWGGTDFHWICTECRSVNENRNDRCYRCLMARADAVLPVLASGAAADPTVVGIAVGPGLPGLPQPANWLEEDGEDEEVEGLEAIDAPNDGPDPDAALAPALAVAAPEAASIFEPLVLEPRVKGTRRSSSPRPSPSRPAASRTARRG